MLLWPGQRAAAGKQTSAVGAKAQQQQQQQPPHSLISSTAEAGASSSALFAADPGPSSAHTTSYVDAEAEGCVEQDDEGERGPGSVENLFLRACAAIAMCFSPVRRRVRGR